MDSNIAVGVGLGLILVVLMAAATTDAVSEAVRVLGRLFKVRVRRKERLLRAITRYLTSTVR